MEIVLVRHGQPVLPMRRRISGIEIGEWVSSYNEMGIVERAVPPDEVLRHAASITCVMASNCRRSVESAARLASMSAVRIDPELREAALPKSLGLSVRLPAGVWVVLARVAWWLRCGDTEEDIHATRQRADRVATRLCALADQYGAVLVVGHGMFNRFLAQQLARRGWQGPMIMPTKYWSAARFSRPKS
jgi:broad specificity phosphatase PhoE